MKNIFLSLLISIIFQSSVFAIPPEMCIQGKLVDSSNKPITGDRQYQLAFYNTAQGGSEIGSILTGSTTISSSGYFNIIFSPSTSVLELSLVYVQVGIDSANPADGQVDDVDFFPERIRLNSVPFALRAQNSSSLNGVPAAEFITRNSTGPAMLNSPNPKQIAMLKWYKSIQTFNTFPVGTAPGYIAFDGERIWVTNRYSDNITVLHTNTGELSATYTAGYGPYGIAFDGANMWVANRDGNSVSILKASDGTKVFSDKAVGGLPLGITFDGEKMWVCAHNEQAIYVFKASDASLLNTITINDFPSNGVFDGQYVWVIANNFVYVFNAANYTQVFNPIDVIDSVTWDIKFDGKNIWVTVTGGDKVVIIGAGIGQIIKTLTTADGVGDGPSHLAFDGTCMWVSNEIGNTISIFRATDQTMVSFYYSPGSPRGLCFDGSHVWSANNASNSVFKF